MGGGVDGRGLGAGLGEIPAAERGYDGASLAGMTEGGGYEMGGAGAGEIFACAGCQVSAMMSPVARVRAAKTIAIPVRN